MKVQLSRGNMFLVIAAAFIVSLILPLYINNNYILSVFIMIFFYIMVLNSWNLLAGYAGQLSLCQAAFVGVGAYTSTLLYLWYHLSPWIGMFFAGISAMLLGVGIGYPCFRLKGPFFALATFGLGEMIRIIFLTARSFTGGAVGLLFPLVGNSFVDFQFLDSRYYLYIIIAFAVASLLVTYQIERSKIGYCLRAIRQDQDAANMIGINVTQYKLIAAAISAFIAGVAGTFYAQYLLFIDPTLMAASFSDEILLMGIIGGAGTLFGPVLVAAILVPFSEIVRAILGGTYQGVHLILYGVVVVVLVLLKPAGLAGWIGEKIAQERH